MQPYLRNLILTSLMAGTVVVPTSGQQFNVDYSADGVAPPATFAAAGSAGVWNAVNPVSNQPISLVDTEGNATGVTATLMNSLSSIFTAQDSSITGDAATLLLDGLAAVDIPEQLLIEGLAEGEYDVIAYGILPGSPTSVTSFISDDLGTAGGAYPGGFEEGVTHARGTVTVGADGMLTIGWVSGVFEDVGFMSGFQLGSATTIFSDGFESGNTSAWTSTSP